MKPFVLVFAVCLFCLALSVRADITQEINSILRDKLITKAEIGVEVVRLGQTPAANKLIYRSNSDIPLIPASNMKVVTTSAAIDQLGPDFKFKTQLVFHDGNLILIGDGDPSFGDAELLSRVGWDVTTVYQHWAEQIKKLNETAAKLGPIKAVIVDDSIFDQTFFHPNWSDKKDPQHPFKQRLEPYEAEVSGMCLNVNCFDVYVRPTQLNQKAICLTNPQTHYVTIDNQCLTGEGQPLLTRPLDSNEMTLRGKCHRASEDPISITVKDPGMYAATVLSETLTTAGITIAQAPRRDLTMRQAMLSAQASGDKSWQVIGIHESPLMQIVGRANKDSMNLYGECLCKRLGAQASGQSGSWQNGTEAVGRFLTKIGVSATQFRLDDGCGLSKENLISADAITRVLIHNYFSPSAKPFIDSLSIAGVDGTLKSRFSNTTLKGRVFAKTGTVDGVSTLSGYLNAKDGNVYAFSILVNNSFSGGGRPTQEKIIAAVDAMK